MRFVLALLAAFSLMMVLGQDEAQGCAATETLPCLELRRDDQVTTVQQTARDSEGGIFGSRTFSPEDACGALGVDRTENRTLTTFYAPAPRLVETRIDDTLITGNIVLRVQPEGEQDQATLEIFGGTLEYDPATACPERIERSSAPEVTLSEGRTTVRGAHLLYDNASGDSVMTGQVSLERAAEGDSPALSASSDRLEFNADEDERVFTGNVSITSEDRVSEADTLVYDDESGVAVLTGDPASSRQGDEFVQGRTIIYYLDSNDIVVSNSVSGEVELELGGEPAPPEEGAPGEP